MKKFLGILIPSLLVCNTVFAAEFGADGIKYLGEKCYGIFFVDVWTYTDGRLPDLDFVAFCFDPLTMAIALGAIFFIWKHINNKNKKPETINTELSGKLKKLTKLYKDGTLSKAEFEKAKDKLLK